MFNYKISIISILIITNLITYIWFDYKSYYYGLDSYTNYSKLPFNVKPIYNLDFPLEFCFEDRLGFRGLGQYSTENGIRLKIIEYGIDDSNIFIKAIDTNGVVKIVKVSKDSDDVGSQFQLIQISSTLYFNQVKEIYNVSEDSVLNLQSVKGGLEIIFVILIFLLIYFRKH